MSIYGNYFSEGSLAEKNDNKPLDKDQIEEAKKVKACIKKYAPDIVSSMNSDKDAISDLNDAISKSGNNKLKSKYVYNYKGDTVDTISFYCVDKSIVNAIGNDEKEAISKPIRKVLYAIANKLIDKIAQDEDVDFDKVSISDDMYSFDGGITIEIYGNN